MYGLSSESTTKGYTTGIQMYYIGIDLGGTNIAAGVVDSDYKIIVKDSVPTLAYRENNEVIHDMADLCAKLVKNAGLTFDDIEYAGIASPGTIDPINGIVIRAENLNFHNFRISDTLKSFIPVKRVILENDANAAALGEVVAGAAKGMQHAVMVTLGTGVGGGIIVDGKVYSGFNFCGAEIGHIVIEHNGRECTCGRKGCFEAYSSATGLVNMTKEKIAECGKKGIPTIMGQNGEKINGRTAFNAMRAGDAPAKEIVDMYISYLACGITNLINIFSPEVLIVGGGVCNEGSALIDPLKEIVYQEIFSKNSAKVSAVKVAELGNDAGIIGAAALGV